MVIRGYSGLFMHGYSWLFMVIHGFCRRPVEREATIVGCVAGLWTRPSPQAQSYLLGSCPVSK